VKDQTEQVTETPEKRPFVEPRIDGPMSLVGTERSLILQASSGGTLDGGPGPSDGTVFD
jgi:hypothetical protein